MTDPFKNQRYEFDKSTSLPHSLSDYNRGSIQSVSSLSSSYNFNNSPKQSDVKSGENNRQTFVQAHIEDNQELIKQLKNNIELLFKATDLVGQIAFFPLKVLRWQCQINSESTKYHILPFTLFPVVYNLNYNGCVSLWKGCFSVAAYYGIKTIIESVIMELSSFEKNLDDVNKSEKLYGHAGLKFLSNMITTPIYSAVMFESVQSGISYENLGMMDLVRESWNRITGYKYNYRTRLIPIWSLILPTTTYFFAYNFISYALENILFSSISMISKLLDDKRNSYGVDQVEEEVIEQPYFKALSHLAGKVCSLVALYPMETVINRMIVQGTRTIIDNTDNGVGVIPINTRYDGFWDCVQTISEVEGTSGFFKGVGALVTETILCYALLRLAKTIAIRIYDSEWTAKSDNNSIKNLMTSSEKYPNPNSIPN